jgi:hypothetical protein
VVVGASPALKPARAERDGIPQKRSGRNLEKFRPLVFWINRSVVPGTRYHPRKRAGGKACCQIHDALYREGPRRAGEPSRPAGDRVDFRDRKDIGIRGGNADPSLCGEHVVSVGGDECNRADASGTEQFDGFLECRGISAELGRISRGAPADVQKGELNVVDFDCCEGSVQRHLCVCDRGTGEKRNHEYCC